MFNVKKGRTFLLLLVFGLALLATGCGGGEPTEKASSPGSDQVKVEDLLAKGKNLPGMSFESVITQNGKQIMSSKVWQKGANTRVEMDVPEAGGKMISIMNTSDKIVYTYNEKQGMATKIPLDQSEVNASSPQDYTSDMNSQTMKYIKTETIDGEECLVYEVNSADMKGKVWICKDHGLPVRVESTSEGQSMVMEYKNIVVGDIADSMFQLPAGVEVMDLENMNLPQMPQIPQAQQ